MTTVGAALPRAFADIIPDAVMTSCCAWHVP
jgi:hypothetical protein